MAPTVCQGHPQTYPPILLPGSDYIRLLDLAPGRRNDDFEGRLQSVRLCDRPTYTALSYVWGPATEGKTIGIDSKHKMPITDNLHRALRRIRHRRNIVTLWIDAICINQADASEKSRQVAIMGDIYGAATDTIVWLGESNRTSSIHLQPAFAHLMSFEYYIHLWISDICWTVQKLFNRQLDAEHAAVNRSELNDLSQWHNRAWTVQEFILSRKVYLYWGKAKIKYSRSTLPYDFIMTADPGTLTKVRHRCGVDVFDTKHRINILEAFRGTDFAGQRLIDAYNALFTYSGLPQATDPRDRVYSVLGLVDSEEARLIGVDYSLTCEQVSAKASFASIKRYGDLEILFYVQLKRPSTNTVPSWAVDFINTPIPNWQSRLDFQSKVGSSRFSLDSSCSRLTVRAYLLDDVVYVRPISVCSVLSGNGSVNSLADPSGSHSRTMITSALSPVASKVTAYGEDVQDRFHIPHDFGKASIQQALEHNSTVLQSCGLNTTKTMDDVKLWHRRTSFVLNAIATKGSGEGKAFMTAGGLIGWAPWTLQPGCLLLHMAGSDFLLALQPSGKVVKFLGMACVPGVGANVTTGSVQDEQDFVIV